MQCDTSFITEPRCVFPDELIRSWNFTYRSAKYVAFAKKTFTITLMDGNKTRFDCSVKDGDLYVFRYSKCEINICYITVLYIAGVIYIYQMSVGSKNSLLFERIERI